MTRCGFTISRSRLRKRLQLRIRTIETITLMAVGEESVLECTSQNDLYSLISPVYCGVSILDMQRMRQGKTSLLILLSGGCWRELPLRRGRSNAVSILFPTAESMTCLTFAFHCS